METAKAKQELIYFWLKNNDIFKESISLNFSSKYNCSYNEISTELDAKKIEEDNEFFGKNITFSVLVGENGTGKSTIIKILNSILDHSKKLEDIKYKFVVLFSDGAHKTNVKLVDTNKFLTSNKIKTVFTGYFDSETAYQNKILQKDINISTQSVLDFMYANYRHNDINNFNIFLFKPVAIELNPQSPLQLKQKIYDVFLKDIQKNNSDFLEYSKKIIALGSFMTLLEVFPSSEYEEIFLLYHCLKNSTQILDFITAEEFLQNFSHSSLDIMEIVLNNSNVEIYEKEIDRFSIIIDTLYAEDKPLMFDKILPDLHTLISIYPELLEYDFIDIEGRRYSNLSHGEKTVFSLFIHIDEIIRDFYRTSCIILLDEPDLSLHPNWQKLLISDLITNFSNKENFIQFIITTHSPFILSDMPPGNVTYFRKDSQTNKSYMDKDQSNKNKTFGANIHTLLSDNFFMNNGLMGEFALKKISDIFSFHEEIKRKKEDNASFSQDDKEKIEQFEQLKNIIGDDYLSSVISNHIDGIKEIVYGNQYDEYEFQRFIDQFGKDKIKNYLDSLND